MSSRAVGILVLLLLLAAPLVHRGREDRIAAYWGLGIMLGLGGLYMLAAHWLGAHTVRVTLVALAIVGCLWLYWRMLVAEPRARREAEQQRRAHLEAEAAAYARGVADGRLLEGNDARRRDRAHRP